MRTPQTIQETREVLAFIVAVYERWQKINADGKVTMFEWPHFLGEVAEARAAFKGISSLPAELNDLDGSEAEEIIDTLAKAFGHKIEGPRRLAVDKALIAFHALLDAIAEFRGANPPRAEIAERGPPSPQQP